MRPRTPPWPEALMTLLMADKLDLLLDITPKPAEPADVVRERESA